jgi:hypothetical protein
LAGTWKVMLSLQGEMRPFWLLRLEAADGKWTGKVLGNAQTAPPATMENVSVRDGLLRFDLKVRGNALNFEVKAAPADKKLLGSVYLGQTAPIELERTAVTSLDTYSLGKEALAKGGNSPELIETALGLVQLAAEKKAKTDEVRSWADKATKASEAYGPRYHQEVLVRLAEELEQQDGFAAVAVEYARRAERALTPQDKPALQKRVLEALSTALMRADKADEAQEVEARLKKIELVKTEPFAGRKAQSDRAVLVELFTGAQCRPCIAADLAFDALGRTYKPNEVVLLQYHLHIPAPDPLTNADAEARAEFYGIDSTPSIFFSGKAGPPGGGSSDDAPERYREYRSAAEPVLEKPARAKLQASAEKKGTKVAITAEVTDLDKPGEQVRLRLALVEERVHYIGANRLPQHHGVVRALPGGNAGFALKDKSTKHSVTIDLDDLRKALKKYLDDFTAEKAPFPGRQPALDFKNLRVVAFVQDDKSKEVLQAVQVEVKAEKE